MSDLQIIPQFIAVFRSVAEQTGLVELIGGPDAFEQGVWEIQQGCLPLLAELKNAETLDIDLSDAVYSPDTFPHLTKFHGTIYDVLVGPWPALLIPWIKRLLTFRLPDDGRGVRRLVAEVAIRGINPVQRNLARLFLFEALCISQRAELLRQGVRVEELGGRRRDLDEIAQVEMEAAVAIRDYSDTLLEGEDPLQEIAQVVMRRLEWHLEVLREELHSVSDVVSVENIKMRRKVLALMDQLAPDEALIVYNESAKIFDGEQVTANQLRIMHPVMLGEQSREAIYQKVHRLPEKISRIKNGELVTTKQPSLLDLILSEEKETN